MTHWLDLWLWPCPMTLWILISTLRLEPCSQRTSILHVPWVSWITRMWNSHNMLFHLSVDVFRSVSDLHWNQKPTSTTQDRHERNAMFERNMFKISCCALGFSETFKKSGLKFYETWIPLSSQLPLFPPNEAKRFAWTQFHCHFLKAFLHWAQPSQSSLSETIWE